jgi:hypothetical protein
VITFLKRILWEPPPKEDSKLTTSLDEFRNRSMDLIRLQEKLRDIQEVSKSKQAILRKIASTPVTTPPPPLITLEEVADGRGSKESERPEEDERSSVG